MVTKATLPPMEVWNDTPYRLNVTVYLEKDKMYIAISPEVGRNGPKCLLVPLEGSNHTVFKREDV